MIAGLITNGYLLTAERIERLNRAGLEHLQISIDNVQPDEVSKKSLKVLDKKLQLLAGHAEFHVNINSVVGGGIHNPRTTLAIIARARLCSWASPARWELSTTAAGSCGRWPSAEREGVSRDARSWKDRSFARFTDFQDDHGAGPSESMALPRRRALPVHLRGRAGALLLAAARLSRHSTGRIHRPGHPARVSTRAKVARRNCTVSCVQQIAMIDNWRDPQSLEPPGRPNPTPAAPAPARAEGSIQEEVHS